MSGGGIGQRFGVFAVFLALAAVGALPLVRGPVPGDVHQAQLELMEREILEQARFHPAARPDTPPGTAAFCAGCHPLPPHGGSRVTDAMTNGHSQIMDCLVCHWSPAAGPQAVPSWQVLSGSAFLAALPAEGASRERLTALRAAVTAVRRCFDRGRVCAGCHRPGGFVTMARPGTPPQMVAALERLEDYFLLAPGEKWYFPQFQ